MSLATSISQIHVEEAASQTSARTATWFEVRQQDLPRWNEALLATDTSLYQYPFWNEPYRPLWLTPRYLAWGTSDRPLAFVTILTVGFGSVKIGLVFRGPSCIQSRCAVCHEAISELVSWAKHNGYMFIRFTHSDPKVLTQLAMSGHAEDVDAFPYFLDYPVLSPDYVVNQYESDEETLSGFDREVRRKLRRADEMGYEFREEESPEALEKAWPLYQDCARRKHFRLERPLSVYMETMRLAQAHNCARLYSVYKDGALVGSALVFRDGSTAHCQLAAFEATHRQSAVFLHWHAMRAMYRLGALRYNLGPGPNSLARFKKQFCSTPVAYPGALTLVLNEPLYRIWRTGIFPVAKRLRPMLRKIVSHVKS